MSDHSARRFLICYDVANPRRLGRIHRFMTRHGMPIQYSLFESWLTPPQLRGVIQRLTDLIDVGEDDVRIYSIRTDATIACLGQPTLPTEIQYFNAPDGVPPIGATQRPHNEA